jgi:hypothetical protein
MVSSFLVLGLMPILSLLEEALYRSFEKQS